MLVCVRFCVVRAIYYLRKTEICSSFRKKVVRYLLQNSGGCVILIEGAWWKWHWLLCFGCFPSLFWMTGSHSGLMLSSRKRSSQRPLLLTYHPSYVHTSSFPRPSPAVGQRWPHATSASGWRWCTGQCLWQNAEAVAANGTGHSGQ